MKELFPGYQRKTLQEINKIWESGIILFDTNVLLNLYRYSESTRDELLELIKKFSDRIYLPHQAALEFNRNRYVVISQQEKAYNDFTTKIEQIQKDLQTKNTPPFLTHKVDIELKKVFEKVSSEVKIGIEKYKGYLNEDPIYDRISDLFKDKITKPYNEDELKNIYREGDERYKLKKPPGFEDEKKEVNRKYGDLILWKQVIDLAKKLKKDVILLTDERKIDWWWIINNDTMGPRPELVEEIKIKADVEFHMYSSERFLEYGNTFFNEKIDQQAVDEITAIKTANMEAAIEFQLYDAAEAAIKLRSHEKNKERTVWIEEFVKQINLFDALKNEDLKTFEQIDVKLKQENKFVNANSGKIKKNKE